jgi:hypothetical protein
LVSEEGNKENNLAWTRTMRITAKLTTFVYQFVSKLQGLRKTEWDRRRDGI